MTSLQVKDIDEGDSGLGTISDVTKTNAAFARSVDGMGIITSELESEVSEVRARSI